jgi:hypothetical protein
MTIFTTDTLTHKRRRDTGESKNRKISKKHNKTSMSSYLPLIKPDRDIFKITASLCHNL